MTVSTRNLRLLEEQGTNSGGCGCGGCGCGAAEASSGPLIRTATAAVKAAVTLCPVISQPARVARDSGVEAA